MAFEQWAGLLPGVTLRALEPRRTEGAEGSPSAEAALVPLAAEAMTTALAGAGLGEALTETSRRAEPLTIVVNDAHRFTDTRTFLDALFALLDQQPRERVCHPRLLVAAGSHRSTAAERAEHEERVLGPHRARFDAVAWHDARNGDGLTQIGSVQLHRWMAEGGLFVACGSVEPHYFAGVTGAHKTLTVGLMSMRSLTANHEGAMSPDSGGFRLQGNPVHEGVCRALADLEANGAWLFALNQIVVGGAVIACAAGSPLDALEALLPRVREVFAAEVLKSVDLVIARPVAPLDRDLYQADKGIKNTEIAVRDGGVLVLEAECAGGVGLDHFVELLRAAPTHRTVVETVDQRGYRLGDHKAVRLRHLTDTRGVSLAVVSASLDPQLAQPLGASIFADRISAASWVCRRLGKTRTVSQGLFVNDAGNLSLDLAARV